ncbi:hypothetical protein O7634_22555 [Micromonospora sp. WMMD1120]|uniref:hypothetical protein n=1 Tax=Micromonospora sp. WMMD1120 TaxID=3016106 RepID=UPI002417036F|nr:hypothetical protein [Micromonospora sp. WMMD1120]MDG4809539.1 hypothetical protein [Micromonospora sp. WMMD1120]
MLTDGLTALGLIWAPVDPLSPLPGGRSGGSPQGRPRQPPVEETADQPPAGIGVP